MNSIDLLRSLDRYSVFDLATFGSLTGLENPSARIRVYRMKKKAHIFEVQRNIYTVHIDPLIVASKITWPSYISLWYALNYHGLTHQIPQEISILTPKRLFRKEIPFMGAIFRFHHLNPSYLFGFDKLTIDGKEVCIAKGEKALVDAVLLKKISTGEVMEILKTHMDALDIKLMIQYLLRTQNKALAKRMGYILEGIGIDCYKKFKLLIYQKPIRLDYSIDRDGPIDDRWGIIDNVRGHT